VSKIIKVGTCGYPVSREKYYKNFDCIEINVTFYQLPEIKTATKWKKESPEGFEFIIKAWQLITHPASSLTYRRLKEKLSENKKKNYGFFQPTDEVYNAWKRTSEFARELGCSKILFQCPSSFTATQENIKNFKKFFRSIKNSESDSFIFIWEPRGNSWTEKLIKQLCKELDLVHCVDPTRNIPVYGKFNYFRLHGTYYNNRIDYNYQFSESELKKVKKLCNKSLNYVMFNNSTMFEDAKRFQEL